MNLEAVQGEFTGACLCGAVRFRIHSALAPIQICHCPQCGKAQGGPFATNIPVARSAFEIVGGLDQLRRYESTPGKFRHFCGRCGSPIYSSREALPLLVRVRAGLIDGPLPVRPQSQAFVEAKANWWTIDDRLPAFPRARDGAADP
jgi:hypothetical protein